MQRHEFSLENSLKQINNKQTNNKKKEAWLCGSSSQKQEVSWGLLPSQPSFLGELQAA